MNNYKKTNKKAFTLAEVLITLAIIGVVAAMTIPALINNVNDNELKVAWKKAFSELSQATATIVQENGGSLKNICQASNNDDCLNDLYRAHFKVEKTCKQGQMDGNCWHSQGSWTYLNGDPDEVSNWQEVAGFISASGFLYRFEAAGFPDCNEASWVNNIPKCAFIGVDINGFKRPNMVGKDIYFAILTDKKLLPVGSQDDTIHKDDCNKSLAGLSCSAKYLYE